MNKSECDQQYTEAQIMVTSYVDTLHVCTYTQMALTKATAKAGSWVGVPGFVGSWVGGPGLVGWRQGIGEPGLVSWWVGGPGLMRW